MSGLNLKKMLINRYYDIKPFLPRKYQLLLRRGVAVAMRERFEGRWPVDPDSEKKPDKWTGWPDGKQFALVLTHDVDTGKGHDKCLQLMDLELKCNFSSSFNFVAGDYEVSAGLRKTLEKQGFEIGVHGLHHNASLYESRAEFDRQAVSINRRLQEWGAVGFRSPCMYHNLEWIHALDISYDASTFDTDPFEPQPDGMGTIFPFYVEGTDGRGYVELPYTLPQDFTLFVLFREKNIRTWKYKLDWVAQHGGMVLLNTHPDYMDFGNERTGFETYPAGLYRELLEYISREYAGSYWHVLPQRMAEFWKEWPLPKKDVVQPEKVEVLELGTAYA